MKESILIRYQEMDLKDNFLIFNASVYWIEVPLIEL